MQDLLRQRKFEKKYLSEVSGFYCGGEQWEKAQAEWIAKHALPRIEKGDTEVWLYYNSQKELVGYGSLGKTRRRFPGPDDEYVNLCLLPSLAIKSEFQGKPDTKPRYSHQIIIDLIEKAREKQKYDTLTLDVHQDNQRAIRFYKKYDFLIWGDVHRDHLKMYHRLDIQNDIE